MRSPPTCLRHRRRRGVGGVEALQRGGSVSPSGSANHRGLAVSSCRRDPEESPLSSSRSNLWFLGVVEVIDRWREGRLDANVQEEKLAIPARRCIAASSEHLLSEHVLSKQVLSFKCVQVSMLEKCQERRAAESFRVGSHLSGKMSLKSWKRFGMDGVRWELGGGSCMNRGHMEKRKFLVVTHFVHSTRHWACNRMCINGYLLEPKRPLWESLKVSSQEGIISKPCFREIKFPIVYIR